MTSPFTPSPSHARRVKQQLARPEDGLSYELGKAVQELPPLYTRLLAGSISLLVLSALAWTHFSLVDEVAVAPGELIPSAQVRPVRALSGGLVQRVEVQEGERIQKGQVLLSLDSSLPQAEVDRLARSAQLIREDLRRLEAERTGTTRAGTLLQDQLLRARLQEYEARQNAAASEATRQLAVIKGAQVKLAQFQESLKSAQIRERALRTLASDENRAVPRLDYIDSQDRVASLRKDIDAQGEEIRQAQATYQQVRDAIARLKSERQSDILGQLTKRREDLTAIEGQLAQARKQRDQEILKAPVAGTIYSVKATRGNVQTGEELLSILPEGEQLLLEVKVLNRDIGFIQEGMKAKVKIATFPFQEFGTIDGTVVQVSPNAIVDKDLGPVFPTRIKLSKHSLQVRGKTVTFTPGMSASGEIVTRKKSILTFLMEPITRRFDEAFSVR